MMMQYNPYNKQSNDQSMKQYVVDGLGFENTGTIIVFHTGFCRNLTPNSK
jgi:hypothetical protein